MTSIALDPKTWDIYVDSEGCLATIDGCEEIAQCIKQTLSLCDFGDFVGDVRLDVLGALITSKILSVKGVLSLRSFSINFDNTGCSTVKGVRVNFEAITDCGIIRSQL